MQADTLMFFDKAPAAFPLYEAVEGMIRSEFPDATIKVQKTQIAFHNRHGFAYVWLPVRRVKGRPETYIVFTFGLGRRAEHPRIIEATEPYPGRWTHHVIISDTSEVDGQLAEWTREAYGFSMAKSRGRRT